MKFWDVSFILGKNVSKSATKSAIDSSRPNVKDATEIVMKKYDKTFVDLARYDKGEKVLDTVSH